MKKRFALLKTYKYKKQFKVISESPLSKIKRLLFSFLKRKRTKVVADYKTEGRGASYLPAILIAFFVFFILPILWLFYIINTTPPAQSIEPQLNASIVDAFIASYGNRVDRQYAVVYLLDIVSNTPKTYVDVFLLPKRISTEVFIVDFNTYQSELNRQDFLAFVERELRDMGFSVHHVSDFSLVTDGSLVIVPNGLPPENFFEAMSKKEVYVFYIGEQPSREIDGSGTIKSSTFFSERKLVFVPLADVIPENLSVRSTTPYTAKDSPLYRNFYTVVKLGKAVVTIIPVPLDVGWDNGRDAGRDFISIFNDLLWFEKTENFRNMYLNRTPDFYISPSSPETELNTLAVVEAVGSKIKRKFFAASLKKMERGVIYTERGPVLVPFYITNSPESITLEIEGEGTEQLDIFVLDRNKRVIDTIKPGGGFVALGSPLFITYQSNAIKEEGYVFEAVSKQGRREAVAYVEFGTLTVEPDFNPLNARNITFGFYVNGKPIRVEQVRVVFKGEESKYTNVKQVTYDVQKFFGGAMPPGDYEFDVYVGTTKYDVPITIPRRTGLFRLFSLRNIAMLIISAIIYGFGILFARKEEEIFSIDIPDFPPIESIKIPITSQQMLSVIEKVNEMYKWQYTPLTISEVRQGLKLLTYKGRAVYASDFNVQYVLEKMQEKGLVKLFDEYVGITAWEKASGFSIKQAVLYRKLRDLCIENAIPFTKLQRKKGYHVKIKLPWTYIFIYLYDDKELRYIMNNAPGVAEQGLVVVLFYDNEDRREFMSKINTNTKKAVNIRFLIEIGSVLPLTFREFSEKIKELKG